MASLHKNLLLLLWLVLLLLLLLLLLTFSSHQVRAEAIAPSFFFEPVKFPQFLQQLNLDGGLRGIRTLDGRREDDDRNGKVAAGLSKSSIKKLVV